MWLSEFYQTQLPTFDSPESSSSGKIGPAEASQTSRCHALALISGYGDDGAMIGGWEDFFVDGSKLSILFSDAKDF